MLGALSDLFGRNFTIGHLLPSVVGVAATLALLGASGLVRVADLLTVQEGYPLLAKVLVPVGIWLLAVTLLAFNIEILQWREGYFLVRRLPRRRIWRPLEWLRAKLVGRLVARQRRKRQQLLDRIEGLRARGNVSALTRAQCAFALRFPGEDGDPLPFAFGNVVRAFEVYPKELYGFEATHGWARLVMVLPEDRRNVVETAKADVDLGVNLWLASWVFLFEYLVVGVTRGFEHPWFVVGALANLYLSSVWSVRAAARWGDMVKGAFDVYLPDLRRTLGLVPPRDRTEEREMWRRLSHAFLTRRHESLPDLEAVEPAADGGEPPRAARSVTERLPSTTRH